MCHYFAIIPRTEQAQAFSNVEVRQGLRSLPRPGPQQSSAPTAIPSQPSCRLEATRNRLFGSEFFEQKGQAKITEPQVPPGHRHRSIERQPVYDLLGSPPSLVRKSRPLALGQHMPEFQKVYYRRKGFFAIGE